MVRDALFGTFCCKYHFGLNRDTDLQVLGHPFAGGTVHMNRFGQKARPVEVKV